MLLDEVVVVAIVCGIVNHIATLLTMLIVEHIATIEPAAHTTLQLNIELMARLIELPAYTTQLSIDTAVTLTLGIRGGDIVIDDGGLELMEITLVLYLRAICSYIPATCTLAIAQKRI